MNIFARENVGCSILCRLEKDGDVVTDVVRWHLAMVDCVVNRKVSVMKKGKPGKSSSLITEISKGWKVVEVGV